ncbi:MAG: reverse transcriptase domain-containing protein [Bacilli bacterium]
MVLQAMIEETNVKCLIDSGASISIISTKLIDKLNMHTSDIVPFEVTLADGNKITITKCTNINLKFKTLSDIFFKIKLYIMELQRDSEKIILGTDFLKKHKCILDYQNGSFTLYGCKMELLCYDKAEGSDKKIGAICASTESKGDDRLNKIIHDYILSFNKHSTIPFYKHSIKTIDHPPIIKRNYQIPLKLKEKVEQKIEQMLKLNIIRPSNSLYNSPLFPIEKRDNDVRLVVDYRELNKVTEIDHYPLPKITSIQYSIKDCKYFSTIDLKNGFYQIELEKSSQQLTAFSVYSIKYEFIKMPMGLKNAPRTFQRVISQIMLGLNFVVVYMDDILIFSKDYDEHLSHIKEVLMRLKTNNIAINQEKSKFAQPNVIFLGNNISRHGISPNLQRCKIDIKDININTPKRLMSLIGKLNWYRPFIENLSSLMAPLTDKLKGKPVKIEWGDKDTEILQEILIRLNNNITLVPPDPNKKFILYTDSSDLGIGGVLKQNSQLIGLFSHKFNDTELNYTITEKEIYSIYLSLEYFREIVYGCNIEVRCDNKNNIDDKKMKNRRISRWIETINEYSVDMKHIKGKNNKEADAISRIYTLESKEVHNNDDFDLILKTHEEFCHASTYKLYKTIKNHEKFKFITKDIIKNIIKYCKICQIYKRDRIQFGHTKTFKISQHKNDIISSDIVGPFCYFNNNKNIKYYIMTITDHFSRFTRLFKIKNIDSDSIIKHLSNWIALYGAPKTFLSDNGTCYRSENTTGFLRKHNITCTNTLPFNPASNGISERLNQNIKFISRITHNKITDKHIKLLEKSFNETFHTTINNIPSNIFFSNISEKVRNEIHNRTLRLNKQNIKRSNKNRKQYEYKIGDMVLKRKFYENKFEKWEGPFKIIDSKDNNAVIENDKIIERVSIKHLKPFYFIRGGDCQISSVFEI